MGWSPGEPGPTQPERCVRTPVCSRAGSPAGCCLRVTPTWVRRPPATPLPAPLLLLRGRRREGAEGAGPELQPPPVLPLGLWVCLPALQPGPFQAQRRLVLRSPGKGCAGRGTQGQSVRGVGVQGRSAHSGLILLPKWDSPGDCVCVTWTVCKRLVWALCVCRVACS